MEQTLTLKEKIDLYDQYACDFFDGFNQKAKIYDLILNRDDLREQFEKIPDIFWKNVKESKLLYVYAESFKCSYYNDENEYILSKYQDFINGPSNIPVIVYQKQWGKINGKTIL